MKKIINSIAVVVTVLVGVSTKAQSLEEFINTALEKNYQISILKNEVQIAINNNTLGNAGQLPSITLGGAAQQASNNVLQEFTDGTSRQGSNAKTTSVNLSAMVDWSVFDGFRVYAKRDQLAYLEQLGKVNSKFYIEQTVADIAEVYYQLVFENQLLESYRHSFEISSFRWNFEKKRKEIGVGKGMRYQQALVDYQTDSIRILTQLNTIKLLEIEINRVLNEALERELVIQEKSFLPLPVIAKDSLFEKAKNNNQQLQQQRLEELIAETNLRIEKADRYPKIGLFAGYQYVKTTAAVGFFKGSRTTGPVVGVNVSFNLYNGRNETREIKNAEFYEENSKLNKEQVVLNINADLLKMIYQYESVQQRIELAQSNMEAAKKVSLIAEEQLKQGAINGYDFRMTQQTLLDAQNALSQLQFSLKTLEIGINRLTGAVLEAYL